jgi:pilus assembly protein FimV
MIAAALWLAGPMVHAVGLGQLSVISPLGQPLNAEIEIVSLQPGEEEGLVARLASPDAFRAAGIDFNPALVSVRFAIERRGGRPLLRVRTTQPVNDPFLEMLVELQWTTGRLVREYTVLLDPPEYKGPQVIAAAPAKRAAAPEPKPAEAPAAQPAPEPARARASAPAPVEAKPLPSVPAAAVEPAPVPAPAAEAAPVDKPAPAEAEKPAAELVGEPAPAEEGKVAVKKGDTLSEIARQHLPPGANLNQMLIAIYRANEDAFIRKNVNLLRAGRVLNIPGADVVSTIDPEEAKRLVQAHMDDFAAYRGRLAAASTSVEAPGGRREAEGRIEPKPEAPAAAPQDQVRLSKADPGKPAALASRAAREDDLVARERALKEAQSRVTELEKNVADLQKLLEMKNQQLAELEKKAQGTPAPVVPAPVAKAPEIPVAQAPKPAPEAPKPAAEAPKPAAEAPRPAVEAPKPVPQAPKPPAQAAKPKPKPAPPPPEPSIIDEFLDNPIALAGLAGVIVLLAGYGVWTWRKKKTRQTRFQDSVLGAATAGGAASGTGAAIAAPSVSQGSLSQPLPGMGADEVDPIAEADVYMAYGRDTQAEEILKEALQKDTKRTAVHSKLLEIYVNRRDTKAFEETALKLKSLTNGFGPEWDKAAALGRSIDPQNGLYGGGAAPAAVPAAAAAAAAPNLDFDLSATSTQRAAILPEFSIDEPKAPPPSGLDFDLDAAPAAADATARGEFTPEGTLIMGERRGEKTVTSVDFDLDVTGSSEAKRPGAAVPASADSGLDFDIGLDLGGEEKRPEPDKTAAPLDLSSISLDLGAAGEPSASPAGTDPKWQEVATKLDLAKAYEEMGDKDGARELLNEVMKDGDTAQKGQAQQLLAKLG